MNKLESSIDLIGKIRIKMLEDKMSKFMLLVGRKNESFGKFFIRKYGSNASVEMTKSLALLDDKVMEEIGLMDVGKSIGLTLEFGDGFDMIIKDIQVEKKNTTYKNKAVAAVGNKFSHNKVDNHWVTRYEVNGTRISELWDGIINLGKSRHPETGWNSSDSKNAGFSKLQVHNSDKDCITILHGSINTLSNNGKKFVHFLNEKVNGADSYGIK